ncbi:MAG TPA: head-tail connector protein [Clostridiaceae bacterium]
MELEELKLFLRVDGTEEDALISSLQLAAEVYLANAGVVKDYANDLYTLVVRLLVTHWYENRETFINMKSTKIDFSIETILCSLKYSQVATV